MNAISCPYFEIKIRQRSKGQSAVAGAAYQSGEKLFSEYDQRSKSYTHKSSEVLAKGIMLPANAPPEYANRQTLWNAVEKSEKQWNAQLSRGIIMAIPRELPETEYENLIRDYCQKQFVSKGMVADFAIHDKGDGNPHAHIMLTMRAFDENGDFLPKAHKVYDLDEDGQRIRLPSGEWKSHKENTVDWNDRGKAEIWRSAWAEICNRYLERAGSEERLDLRSYERQGRDELPTIHLGPAVAHLEKKGVPTEIGNYNRAIKAHNSKLSRLRKLISDISSWLKRFRDAVHEVKEEMEPQPTILDYLNAYTDMRKAGRIDWSTGAKRKASIKDLQTKADVFAWMERNKIFTLADLDRAVSECQADFDRISENRRAVKKIETGLKYINTVIRLKSVADKAKSGFKLFREKYAEEHADEIAEYNKAVRYLKANQMNPGDRDIYSGRRNALLKEIAQTEEKLRAADLDPEIIRTIWHRVDKVNEAGGIPEKKESVIGRLEQSKTEGEEKKREERQNKENRF